MTIELEYEVREGLEGKIPEVLEGLPEEARANFIVNLYRNVYDEKGTENYDLKYFSARQFERELSPEVLSGVVDTLIEKGAVDNLCFLGKVICSNSKYGTDSVIKIAESLERELLEIYDDDRTLDDLFKVSGKFVAGAAIDVVQPKDDAPKKLLAQVGEMYKIVAYTAQDEQRETLEDKAITYSIKGGNFKVAADVLDQRRHRIDIIEPTLADMVNIMRRASCLAVAGELVSAGYTTEKVVNMNGYDSWLDKENRDEKILAEYALRAVDFFAEAGKNDRARWILNEHASSITKVTGRSVDDLFEQGLNYCKSDEEKVLFAIEFKRRNVRKFIGSKAEAKTYDEVIDLAGEDFRLKARAAFECGQIRDSIRYLEQSGEILGAARLAKRDETQSERQVDFWEKQIEEKKRCDEQKIEYWAERMYRNPTVELEEAVDNNKFFSGRARELYYDAVTLSLEEDIETSEKIARESGNYDLVANVKAQSDEELARAYEVFKFEGLRDTEEATERVLEDSLLHSDFATAHVAAKRLNHMDKANEYAFLHETLKEHKDEKDFTFYCPNKLEQTKEGESK